MKYASILPATLIAAAIAVTGCNDSNTVGVVDVERVMKEASAAEAARQHLASVKTTLQDGLKKLEIEWKDADEKTRNAAIADGLNTLNRQMAAEEAAANAVVNKMLREESEKWRASHNALIVTTRQSLLASGSEVDITADVLSAMNARSPKFADLPQIEVNPREKVEDNNKKAKK